jgi:RimJ/RimL family protein N-acetyltransferase
MSAPVSKDDRRFEFRALADADIRMLREWLTRPHVAEIWGEVPSEAELRADYLSGNDPATAAFVAWLDREPVGFIQSYVAAKSGDGWWPDETDPGVLGIDQFLADGSRLNQGIGTAMVRAFVARLFGDSRTTRVQTDPSPTNVRAIRCYEKAGFRRWREVETPDGRALLMYCERPI